MTESTFRMAEAKDMPWLYRSMHIMLDEQDMLERFVYTEESLKQTLFSASPLAEVLLIEIESKPVGFALFSKTQRNFIVFEKPGLYLHDIFVAADSRRQGFAKALFSKLSQIAEDRGCGRIEGGVLKKNTPALELYETLGAKEVEHLQLTRYTMAE